MINKLNTLTFTILSLLLFVSCKTKPKTDDTDITDVNKEFHEEYLQLEKERMAWLEEYRTYKIKFSAYQDQYQELVEYNPSNEYLDFAEKQEKLDAEHTKMISDHHKFMDDLKNAVDQHKNGKITTKKLEDEQRDLYKKHKPLGEKHLQLIQKFKDAEVTLKNFIVEEGGEPTTQEKSDSLSKNDDMKLKEDSVVVE